MEDGAVPVPVADKVDPYPKKKAPPKRGGTEQVYCRLTRCQINPNIDPAPVSACTALAGCVTEKTHLLGIEKDASGRTLAPESSTPLRSLRSGQRCPGNLPPRSEPTGAVGRISSALDEG